MRASRFVPCAALAILLAGCANVGLRETSRPVLYGQLPRCSLNGGSPAKTTSELLRRHGLSAGELAKSPVATVGLMVADSGQENRLAAAEACMIAGKGREKTAPAEALGCYLSAAERTFPLAARRDADPLAVGIYNHSCGLAAALALSSGASRVAGPAKSYAIEWKSGPGLFSPGFFDQLKPADQLQVTGFRHRTFQAGLGGPMVGIRLTTPERKRLNPNMPSRATALAATATVEFNSAGRAAIRLHDVLAKDSAAIGGQNRALSADFTAPLAQIMHLSPVRHLDLLGLFQPEKHISRCGLFLVEPFRPNKIPVVFIHGLLSEPATWKDTYNDLIADPRIRERYQFWVFQYPTGYPFIYPAAKFRQELAKTRRYYDPQDALPALDHIVLVGHSMGGLIASTQIRNVDPELWPRFFKSSLENLRVDEGSREALRQLFLSPPQPYIDRVVFIAVPHRGSSIAGSWVGKLANLLIELPKEVLTLQVPEILASVTDMGRTLLDEAPTSITRLRMSDPVLNTLLSRPIDPRVPYHSIIGDRGRGDTPNSSDGVVKYVSSHLDGAASEKIVPAWHNAHGNPEAIAELARILKLHAAGR